jgi:hypothetical protein
VRALRALASGGKVDENTAVLDLHRVGGNAVLLETWLAYAAAAVKFPIMPGADDVFALKAALAKWPAGVVANIRNRAEFPILERYCKLAVPCLDASERRPGKLVRGADVDLVFISGHMIPCSQLF